MNRQTIVVMISVLMLVCCCWSGSAVYLPDEGQNGNGNFWWHEDRPLVDENDQWGPHSINVDDAWDLDGDGELTNPGSSEVVVAVIDSGILINHEDLADMMWVNPREITDDASNDGRPGIEDADDDGDLKTDEDHDGYVPDDTGFWDSDCAVDDDENGFYDDINGASWVDIPGHVPPQHWKLPPTPSGAWNLQRRHGTLVAGTIAAVIDNNMGIAGVSQVSLMSLKILDGDSDGSEWSTLLPLMEAAIQYAMDHEADIIHTSMGWELDGTQQEVQDVEDLLDQAYNQGILIVACAGNIDRTHDDVWFPAWDPNVISVSGLQLDANWDLEYADYSCHDSNRVEMAAPSGNANDADEQIYQLGSFPQQYQMGWGTSVAAPHVTGVAALVMSVRPDLTNEEVRGILRAACVDVDDPNVQGDEGFDEFTGFGWLDAERAVEIARNYQSKDSFDDPMQPTSFNQWNVEMEVTMDVDSLGATHLIYTDFNGNYHLRYTMINRNGEEYGGGDVWITDFTDFQNDVREHDIYIDYINKVHITFVGDHANGIGDIFYTKRDFNGDELIPPTRVTNNNNVKHSPHVVANRNGEAFIVWSEQDPGTNDFDLWIAGYTGPPANRFLFAKLFDSVADQTAPQVDIWWDRDLTRAFMDVIWLDTRNDNGHVLKKLYWLQYDTSVKVISIGDNPPPTEDGIQIVRDDNFDIVEFSMCTEYYFEEEDPQAPRTGNTHFVWRTNAGNDEISYGRINREGTDLRSLDEYYVGTNNPHDLSIANCLNGDTYVVWIEGGNVRIQKTIDSSDYCYPVIGADYRTIISNTNVRDPVVIVENDDPQDNGNNPFLKCDDRIKIAWVVENIWGIYGDQANYITSRPIWRSTSTIGSNDCFRPDVDDPDVAFSSDGRMHVVYSYYNADLGQYMVRYKMWTATTVEGGYPNENNAAVSVDVNSIANDYDAIKPKIRTWHHEDTNGDQDEERLHILWLQEEDGTGVIYGRTYDTNGNALTNQKMIKSGIIIERGYDFDVNDDGDGYPTWNSDLEDQDTDDVFVTYVFATFGNLWVTKVDNDLQSNPKNRAITRATDESFHNPSLRINLQGDVYLVYEVAHTSGPSEIELAIYDDDNDVVISSSRISDNNVHSQSPDVILGRPVYRLDKGRDNLRNQYHQDDRLRERHYQKVHVTWVEEVDNSGDVDYQIVYRCYDSNGNAITIKKSLIGRIQSYTEGMNEDMGKPQIISDYQNNIHIVVGTDLYYFYSSTPPTYWYKIYYFKLDTVGNILISEEYVSKLGTHPVVEIKRNDETVVIWEDKSDTSKDTISYKSHYMLKN